MFTVEHDLSHLRITHANTSIQFTYHTDTASLDWINPYPEWNDWQPERIAHQHLRFSLSVLRNHMQSIHTVTTKDSTSFLCNTPGGFLLVPLAPFYIAFHGKSWYEDCADATTPKGFIRYEEMCRNQDDPGFKACMPHWFNWANPSLASLLYPVYDSTLTWTAFFQAIATKWPSHMCGMIYPFLFHYSTDLCKGWIGGSKWNIQMTMDPLYVTSNSTDHIEKHIIVEYERTNLSPIMSEVQKWDYSKWLEQK